jgi:hypothetical protein
VKIDNFFAELKRRNVYKVAVAYAVVDYYDQAMAKDPNYPLAYVGRADSYILLSPYGAISPK